MLLAFSLLLGLPTALVAHHSHRCPDTTWTLFERTGGRFVCIKFFDGNVNRPDAERGCNYQGASLIGFENEQEFEFIRGSAWKSFSKYHLPKGGAYWIDGMRTPGCHKPANGGCSFSQIFGWTNGLTKGTFAFSKWATEKWGEPNNVEYRGEEENCLQGILFYEWPQFNGLLNDYPCSLKDSTRGDLPMYTIYGYVCGQFAQPITPPTQPPTTTVPKDEDCSSEEDSRGRDRSQRRRSSRGRDSHHSSEARRRPRHHSSEERRRPRHDSSREKKRHPTPEEIKARS
ncbi:unnamed protein product [Caenorhabditis auriculariae]|uniref:C-type lectin domain-containing protein n=1 Tax=Caenorhabditis auriculariae TaxID=2777116 RepID=A0A8S1HPY9_9PELO|nr:unnamed protein product [Caenorhabditis auriculariae]